MHALPVIVPRAHDLKILPAHFADVRDGSKRAELRNNDRGFIVGDVLVLREWVDGGAGYSGRFVVARVTHILYSSNDCAPGSSAIEAGYVMLSIDVISIDGRPDV